MPDPRKALKSLRKKYGKDQMDKEQIIVEIGGAQYEEEPTAIVGEAQFDPEVAIRIGEAFMEPEVTVGEAQFDYPENPDSRYADLMADFSAKGSKNPEEEKKKRDELLRILLEQR